MSEHVAPGPAAPTTISWVERLAALSGAASFVLAFAGISFAEHGGKGLSPDQPTAAIGAGFVPIAIGTDTAGSIRNPGGACGGVGLKPTNELLPMGGIFPVAYTLDQVGPLARSVKDIALALDGMVEPGATRPTGARNCATGCCLTITC